MAPAPEQTEITLVVSGDHETVKANVLAYAALFGTIIQARIGHEAIDAAAVAAAPELA